MTLEVAGIHAAYGLAEVLHGVSLQVGERQIVSLLGPNGAGKSTLLRVIAGLMPPRGGSVVFDGERLDRRPADLVVRCGVALVPERRELFPGLSVRENLLLGAYSRSDRAAIAADLEMVLGLFPRLRERAAQTARTLSGGEQQMLAIARGLMSRPRLLLLDEPSLGLAPQLIEEIFAKIGRIRDAGTAILLVEQNAVVALEVADYAYVIEAGEIRVEGTAAALRANPAVQDAYLRDEP